MGGGAVAATGSGRQVQHVGRVARARTGPHRGAGGRDGSGAVGRTSGAHRDGSGGTTVRPPARLGAGRARRPPHRGPLELLGRAAGGAPAGRARGRRREGGAARRRGRVPAHAGVAQHLCRREPVQAWARPRPQGRRGPGPTARPGCRIGCRGRERDGGRLGAPRAGRSAAAGGEPLARLRQGQGLRAGGAARDAAQLRLRGPGGDGHGDDPGRRVAAGAGQFHGQRLRDRAAAGGRDRAGPAGTGPGRGGDDGGGFVGADGDRVPVRGRGVAGLSWVGAGPRGRRPPGADGGVPSVSSQGRVGDGVLRDGRAAGGVGAGADGDCGGGRGGRAGGGGRVADGGGGAVAAAGRGRSRGAERAPLRRSRRPPGRGPGPAAALPPPRGRALRAGRDPALALGGRAGGEGAGTDAGAGAATGEAVGDGTGTR